MIIYCTSIVGSEETIEKVTAVLRAFGQGDISVDRVHNHRLIWIHQILLKADDTAAEPEMPTVSLHPKVLINTL